MEPTIATVAHSLVAGSWSDLGATPASLQLLAGRDVLFVIDTVAPVSLTAPAHRLSLSRTGDSSADIGLTSKVYARSEGGGADVVVSR